MLNRRELSYDVQRMSVSHRETTTMNNDPSALPSIPWFGARKMARELMLQAQTLQIRYDEAQKTLTRLGALTVVQLENRRAELELDIVAQKGRLAAERSELAA